MKASFSDFGLLPSIMDTLKQKLIFKPTEIQNLAIPMMMSGQSVVGVSETGSGKTLTYALPLLNMLKTLENQGDGVFEDTSPRAIVMVPTRELGEQVSRVFKTFTHHTRLRVRPALGGMTMEQARRNISGPFEILLATPGRLVQLIEQEDIKMNDVRVLIFDEADQMLDKGFLPDSETIVEACPKDIQLALFSATVSTPVQELINQLFANAEVLKSSGSGKVVSTLTTQNKMVQDGKRWPLFEKILSQKVEGGSLVFTNTREQCDKLAKELTDKGYQCAIYRGEMEKTDRRANLKKFRDGEIDILVSTDLAARGLDLDNIGRVINYHLPQQMENYLHRVGRTARAGRTGLVINLVTERDSRLIAKLEGKPEPKRMDREARQEQAKRNEREAKKSEREAKRNPKEDVKKIGEGKERVKFTRRVEVTAEGKKVGKLHLRKSDRKRPPKEEREAEMKSKTKKTPKPMTSKGARAFAKFAPKKRPSY